MVDIEEEPKQEGGASLKGKVLQLCHNRLVLRHSSL